MLKKHVVKGQLLAVGKQVYKTAIEEHVVSVKAPLFTYVYK
jgi:hypothetical protein